MTETEEGRPSPPVQRPSASGRVARWLAVIGARYLLVAYVLLPAFWTRRVERHPALADVPNVTRTRAGLAGDPLNVALVGTERDLVAAMIATGWTPADPLTLRSSLRIVSSTLFRRDYRAAPVSNLYLWGRKEDLAFEQLVGTDPRRRHHARFWRARKLGAQGRPLWIGSAAYDTGVELSRTTGEFTHHIASDIDAERDLLFHDLERTVDLAVTYWVDDFHRVRRGRNGGGDPWTTDGRLKVGVIVPRPGDARPAR